MKFNNSSIGLCLKDFIIEFENSKTKKYFKNIMHKKYKPKKINLNIIKNFFDEMKLK